jgi:hypothetical protein
MKSHPGRGAHSASASACGQSSGVGLSAIKGQALSVQSRADGNQLAVGGPRGDVSCVRGSSGGRVENGGVRGRRRRGGSRGRWEYATTMEGDKVSGLCFGAGEFDKGTWLGVGKSGAIRQVRPVAKAPIATKARRSVSPSVAIPAVVAEVDADAPTACPPKRSQSAIRPPIIAQAMTHLIVTPRSCTSAMPRPAPAPE